jgi:hypothetical protein
LAKIADTRQIHGQHIFSQSARLLHWQPMKFI